jgi:AraC-like DNA-binding protein
MIIQDFLPSEAVKAFVQCYRIIHFVFESNQQVPVKAYPPKPENCLHFFLRDPLCIQNAHLKIERAPSILFRGQQTSVVLQYPGNEFVDVQIVFQPTAIFRLTGWPAEELVNLRLDATSFFPKSIAFTFDQLQHTADYREMIKIVDRFAKSLLSQARKDYLPIDRLSECLIQRNQVDSMSTVATNAFYSTKQFKRKFYERVGLNPKLYSRIIRFNKAFNFKNRFPDKIWSVIATECGYVDYQHLAKDYKEFTGLTPPEFHVLESEAPENVLDIARPLYLSRYRPIE